MTLHTSIGDQHFPVEVADPNRLTSYYESYVLIPNLGPLLYSKLHGKLKAITDDFTVAILFIDTVLQYKKQYAEIPPTPYLPDNVVVMGAAIAEGTTASRFMIDEAYARPNTRRPDAVLRLLRTVGEPAIEAAPVANLYAVDDGRMAGYKSVLAGLSRENSALSALAQEGMLLSGEQIVSEEFLASGTRAQLEAMVSSALRSADSAGSNRPRPRPGRNDQLAESMTKTLLHDNAVLLPHKDLMVDLVNVKMMQFFGDYGIVNPADHITVVESCEWAFLRKERITLDLGRPLFRGPLSLNSIAPKSELTLTETESRVTRTGTRSLAATRDDLTGYTSVSSQVENKLGILFDYGSNLGQTMSEQGYTQDSMKNEKRSRVESALREISQQNSTVAMSSETLSTSRVREYRTEGKDPLYATSELSFEVVAPVAVKHHLDGIGAVWAPRITNPFADLRSHLDAYYTQTYLDYIAENYVVDPMQPIPSYENVSRVEKNTPDNSSPGTYTETVSFKLTASEVAAGTMFGEDIRLAFWQHADWYENSYDEDDRWMQIESTDRHGGDTWVDVTVKYHVDDVTGNDPDRHHITVSIDKFKETEAYRQEKNEYTLTTEKTNPARRNAVKVQARKYAALKRDELIRKYEGNADDLKDYAFVSLMKKIFGTVDGNWSYHMGIIRTCIDWDRSRIDPEPCDIASLYADVLSPYHFLNVQAVRFFLPLHPGAEEIFFETMRNAVDPTWRDLFDTVEKYIEDQRTAFTELQEDELLLDSYDSELVLGRHLEAVLSTTTFAEP